jgi:O-antigen/teichoic acid export membrane protein
MSDSISSRFIWGTVSVGAGRLSTTVLGFMAMIVAVRCLSAEAFGTFVLLQVIAAFLTRVSSLGLELSIPKFVTATEQENEKRKIINTTFYFRMLAIVAVSIIAMISKSVLSALFGSSSLSDFIGFILILFWLQSLRKILDATVQGFFLFKTIAIASFLESLSNLLSILLLVAFLDLGVTGLVYAKALSLAVACFFVYFTIPIKTKLEFHYGILRKVLKFGFPLQINDILTFIFLRIDTLIIGGLLGPAEIAYYEIARKIPDSLTGLYEAFRTVYFPFVARLSGLGERKRLTQLLNDSIRLISFVSIFGALIALLFGNEIITFLFSAKYLPSAPIFALLMVGLNLAIVEYTFGYSLVAIGESDKPLVINVVRTAMSLLGNLLLIPNIGVTGAALANIISNSITSPLDVLFLRRKKIFARIVDYMKPLLIFGAIGVLFVLVGANIIVVKVVAIVLFILTCVLLSVITFEDLAVVWEEAKTTFSKSARTPRFKSTES